MPPNGGRAHAEARRKIGQPLDDPGRTEVFDMKKVLMFIAVFLLIATGVVVTSNLTDVAIATAQAGAKP
jgi:hypothetical protein